MRSSLRFAAPALLLATGCAANPFEDRVDVVSAGGLDVITYNSELDVAIQQASTADGRYCLSPGTDAVPLQSVGLALSDRQVGGSDASGDGAATLGGRSPAVLIAREVMYRTCEFSLNNDMTPAQALSLYQQALSTVQAIAAAENQPGTQPVAEPAGSLSGPGAPPPP
jgi:hypothetical protein